MKLNIQKLETVAIKDRNGKFTHIKPESFHLHTVGSKQYLTIVEAQPKEK